MTLLIKPNAVSRLSQLTIDADKDWGGKAITNLKGLAAGMTQGDLFFRGPTAIQRLAPGIAGQFLITRGAGANPEWGDTAGRVERILRLTIPEPSISVAAASSSGEAFTATLSLPVPMVTVSKGGTTSPPLAVLGAVYHDDAPLIDTDETAAANDVAANDMHLTPSPGAVGDGFYFGLDNPFDWVSVNIGTAGAGTWTITWKYFNGVTWTALAMKSDETSGWRTTGIRRAHWNRPLDWALFTVAALNLYWVKAEITSYTVMTTQPLGNQAWVGRY
jgi:hypothetical protein